MPDITHDFVIQAGLREVFDCVSTPEGLDRWWTATSAGKPALGVQYTLSFGNGDPWRARVTRYRPLHSFELELIEADADWIGTRVSLQLEPAPLGVHVHFRHAGWRRENEHYRISCYCWAMGLRVLKRWLEHHEPVPYEQRLQV